MKPFNKEAVDMATSQGLTCYKCWITETTGIKTCKICGTKLLNWK